MDSTDPPTRIGDLTNAPGTDRYAGLAGGPRERDCWPRDVRTVRRGGERNGLRRGRLSPENAVPVEGPDVLDVLEPGGSEQVSERFVGATGVFR